MFTNQNLKKTESKRVSVSKLVPNIITMLSLCFGISSIRFALLEKWQICVVFIFIAAILDMLDGRFARMLNAQSAFGEFFDSLCDFINFGFCPIFIMYLWKMKSIQFFGWGLVLLFSVAMATRLARFNSQIMVNSSTLKSKFFFGVPAPAGAILVLFPLICSFEIPEIINMLSNNYFIIYLVSISFLVVSTIPTFSLKKVKVSESMIAPLTVAFAVFIIALFLEKWKTVMVIVPIYFVSIPFTIFYYGYLLRSSSSADGKGFSNSKDN